MTQNLNVTIFQTNSGGWHTPALKGLETQHEPFLIFFWVNKIRDNSHSTTSYIHKIPPIAKT